MQLMADLRVFLRLGRLCVYRSPFPVLGLVSDNYGSMPLQLSLCCLQDDFLLAAGLYWHLRRLFVSIKLGAVAEVAGGGGSGPGCLRVNSHQGQAPSTDPPLHLTMAASRPACTPPPPGFMALPTAVLLGPWQLEGLVGPRSCRLRPGLTNGPLRLSGRAGRSGPARQQYTTDLLFSTAPPPHTHTHTELQLRAEL